MALDLSLTIDGAKLTALAAIARPRVGEIVQVDWNGGNDTRYYSSSDLNALTGFSGLAAYGIASIESRFPKNQFIDLTRTSDISDDKIDLDFWDGDSSVVTLFNDHFGEGTRVTVLEWYPEVDLLVESFWGHLQAPDEMDGIRFKVKAAAGFRSPNLSLPSRQQYFGCQALFGGHVRADGSYLFPTLGSLADNDCPYDKHLGGTHGVAGFTSCPRNTLAACVARLAETGGRYSYLAFDFFSGTTLVGAGQHKWVAQTRGNESNQNKALRVVAGTKWVKELDLQAFESQSGGSNPQAGYVVTLWALCEGPIVGASDFYVNGQFIGLNHQITNKGELRQPSIPYPTTVLNYSGTAMARLDAGPKDWRGVEASDLNAQCKIVGSNDVRVYTDATTYTKQYTTNRGWWVLNCLTNRRWGHRIDYSRVHIPDWLYLADWCDDTVTTTDTDGSTPLSSTRSTFNADLNESTVQQQFTDICLGGRMSRPFNYGGKIRVIPLEAVGISGDTPTFTDQGSSPNIVFQGGKSTLRWSVKSDEEIINKLIVTFDDAAYSGKEHKIILEDLDQQLKAGIAAGDHTVRVIDKKVVAYGIDNYGEAVRWAKLLLNLGEFDGFEKPGIKNNLRVKFTTYAWAVAAMRVYPFSVIRVLNSRLQAKWKEQPSHDAQWFRVMKMRRLKDQKMEIEAQLYPSVYYGQTETDTYVASSGTVNPGGDRSSRVAPIRPRIVRRTVDTLIVDTTV